MVVVEVKTEFYDCCENCWRSVGSEFETTEERFKELQEGLPGFVGRKTKKKISEKEVVVGDEVAL